MDSEEKRGEQMTTETTLLSTLATFGHVGVNCVGEPTVAILVPTKFGERQIDRLADRIEAQLIEQECFFRCTGGLIFTDSGRKAVELSFVPGQWKARTVSE